jgi:hypothetical protein
MNRKLLMFIIGIAFVSITVTAAVTAYSPLSHTPLYTVRMEQQSSGMHFLPTEMNSPTYTSEPGFDLDFEATAINGEDSELASGHASCIWTCVWSGC